MERAPSVSQHPRHSWPETLSDGTHTKIISGSPQLGSTGYTPSEPGHPLVSHRESAMAFPSTWLSGLLRLFLIKLRLYSVVP